MFYVYLWMFLTRQGNTTTIEAPSLWSRCGRVVYGAGHKAERLFLQCINGLRSYPVEERTQLGQLKKYNANIAWFNLQTYIQYLVFT